MMGIIIQKLYSKNYCGFFGEKEFNLENISGTISLIGDNGTGKSTFLNLLLFIFYGKGKFKTLKDLLNTEALNNSKDANIEAYAACDFYIEELGSHLYTIKREISETSMTTKLFIDKKLYSKKKSEVEEYINSLVKIPYEVAINTIYSEQKRVSNFFNLSNSEKKDFFDTVFLVGFDKFINKNQEISNRAKTKCDVLQALIKDKTNYLHNTVIPQINHLQSFLKEKNKETIIRKKEFLEQESKNLVDAKVKLSGQIVELQEIDNRIKEIESIENDILILTTKSTSINKEKEMVNEEINSTNKSLSGIIDSLKFEKSNTINKIHFDENRIATGLDLIGNLKSEIISYERKLTERIYPEFNKLNNNKIGIESLCKNIEEKIHTIKNSHPDVCSLCGSVLEDKHKIKIKEELQKNEELLNEYKQKLVSISENIRVLKEEEENIGKILQEKKIILQKYENFLQKLQGEKEQYLSNKLKRKEKALRLKNFLSTKHKLTSSLVELQNRLSKLDSELKQNQEFLSQKQEKLLDRKKSLEPLLKRKEELFKIEQEIKSIDNLLIGNAEEINKLVSELKEIELSENRLT
ncbi:MAG: AAA family ATPase, partial [candidate division WOR-3 bacterium]